jgi:hypothetical protein
MRHINIDFYEINIGAQQADYFVNNGFDFFTWTTPRSGEPDNQLGTIGPYFIGSCYQRNEVIARGWTTGDDSHRIGRIHHIH